MTAPQVRLWQPQVTAETPTSPSLWQPRSCTKSTDRSAGFCSSLDIGGRPIKLAQADSTPLASIASMDTAYPTGDGTANNLDIQDLKDDILGISRSLLSIQQDIKSLQRTHKFQTQELLLKIQDGDVAVLGHVGENWLSAYDRFWNIESALIRHGIMDSPTKDK
jgi:hypothetical protein